MNQAKLNWGFYVVTRYKCSDHKTCKVCPHYIDCGKLQSFCFTLGLIMGTT